MSYFFRDWRRGTATLALMFAAGIGSAVAQFDAASVIGTTRDASGAAVPHSRVVLTNVTTGVTRELTSDDSGRFNFPSVPIGQYRLTSDAAGFSHTETPTFALTVSAHQLYDLKMGAAGSQTTVEVEAAPTLLETETSSRGQIIATKQVENMPLNGRSYADLTLLSPGVRKSLLNTGASSTSSREGSFNVNGQRSAFNNFMLDGLDNNNYGTSNQGFANENIAPSPDAVSEFRVDTDNYSAEYGRNPGAVINVSLRSGGNKFHGRVWDYNRNTDFNAIGPFLPTGGNPKFIRNQFGATFGGPIWKNHTFFFMDYEGVRQIFNNTQTVSSLPTVNQRAGLFYLNDDNSSAANAIPLKNPITGTTYLGQIPLADMTPFARAVIAALPANTSAGLTNNFSYSPRGTINDDKGDVRIDHTFNQKLSVFGVYSQHSGYYFDPPGIPGRAGGNSNGNTYIQNKNVAAGVTYAVTPTQLFDARFGWSQNVGKKTPIGFGDTSLLTENGITDGLPVASTRDLNTQAITGFTQLGAQNSNPQFQNPIIFNPKVNYTWVHGRNTLKAGYEFQAVHTQVNDFNPSYGSDTYGGMFSANGNPAAITGTATTAQTTMLQQAQNLADFYFGNRNQYSITNYAVVNLRQRYTFMYLQDDVKLLPNLTVNAGLRYEIVTPQWEADNKLANFDPSTNTLVQAHGTSINDRAQVNVNYNNFAPRFGFSYQATPNMTVRGGYGMVYTQWNRAGGENNLTYNGPNVVNASITQTPSQGLCVNDTQLQSGCFRQTQQGYSNVLTSAANFNPLIATSRYIPKNNPTGYVQQYFLGTQQQVGKWLFDLSYVGNKGTHLQTLADYNQAVSCAATTGCASYTARRPITTFGQIEIAENIGTSNYNAVQFRIERRTNMGLYLLNSFTYGRTFDLSSGHLETGAGDTSRVDYYRPSASYGPSAYDQPLNDTFSVVYDLPYGRGRKFGANSGRLMDAVLGGWQVNLINTMTSGQTLNITYSLSTSSGLYTSSFINYRPDRVLGQNPIAAKSARRKTSSSTLSGALNVNAFALPTTYGVGNLSRNAFRSDAYYNADLGLHKQFPLWNETSKFDFRAEAFNVLNKVNYGAPSTTFGVGSSSFGAITSAFPARQLQLAAKVIF
ncbi:TonB-dependent receptor domain-containing protein [Granulicella cerasi]|uniref:TonB-dependent receptor domain-containing protein n=1 Tax=Granulicella cerasi TaxID=741063 RepID=A0ABW1Z738_9BACT|nr:TonB-dependent receptor [Granulicella cerasi]